MSTINAILEPDPDGTLHLPLPPELRHGKVKVEATLLPIHSASDFDEQLDDSKESGTPPRATPEMLRQRTEAGEALRAMGGLKDVIPDPVAWQREIREDRKLPGRE